MGHRIHEESETSVIIGDNARSKEDYEMFCKFGQNVLLSSYQIFMRKVKNPIK